MKNFSSVLYKILGQRIKSRREELNLNQNDLSDRVNIGRASISNIEQGRQKPPLSVIYKICDELDVDIHSILPTYKEIEETINLIDNSSLKKFYDHYNLDEKTKEQIDNLFKDKKNDI